MNSSEYLDYIQENMPKNVKFSKWAVKIFSQTGIDMSFFSDANDEQIIMAIINTGVSSMTEINNLTSVIRNYYAVNNIAKTFSINPKIIFTEIRKSGTAILKRKFIDANSFNALLYLIKSEKFWCVPERGINNGLWYATFLDAIWHGIYSSDFSAIYNLRVSDIHGNYIRVKPEDAPSFECYCDSAILLNMVDTANLKAWYNNSAIVSITGKYDDSIFKFERRKGNENSGNYRFTYNSRLKYISKGFLEYSLTPKNLYISGVVNRITNRLSESDILGFEKYEDYLDYVFGVKSNTTRLQGFVKEIISEELEKTGYSGSFYNLKRYVSGNISDFIPDQSEKPVWIK